MKINILKCPPITPYPLALPEGTTLLSKGAILWVIGSDRHPQVVVKSELKVQGFNLLRDKQIWADIGVEGEPILSASMKATNLNTAISSPILY